MIFFFEYLITLRDVIRLLKVKLRSVCGHNNLLPVPVSLLFVLIKDGTEASEVIFSGTIVRSGGIVATYANCLKHLKGLGTKHEIGVKILGWQNTYKGVLLHTDFLSNIASVKVLCRKQLEVPKWGKLGSVRKGEHVVGAGCYNLVGGNNWKNAKSGYSAGLISSIDDNDKEKTQSHNAIRTSGRFIKASCRIGKPGIGGALVSWTGEVYGVIHKYNARGSQIEATSIDDVLKYLEYMETKGKLATDTAI